MSHILIAIDGPAASGKSSVARTLARRLRYVYVNTGAMYRAMTWWVLKSGVDPTNAEGVVALLDGLSIETPIEDNESLILIGGEDPSAHLNDADVNRAVSSVSGVPQVREILVAKQRAFADTADIVMEGRDIGSAVFPFTPYKFYVDASPEIRAMRRARQGMQDEIAARDRHDSSRRASPLVLSEDAHVIDSSHLTIDGVVGEVIGRLKLKGLQLPPDL